MYIKTLLTLFLCSFSFAGYSQEKEMNEILTKPKSSTGSCGSSISSAITGAAKSPLHGESTAEPNIKEKSMSVQKGDTLSAKSFRGRSETSVVSTAVLNGYHFHVADHPDGTRVVTCLDGNMKGYQAMSFNGVVQAQSSNVHWHAHHHFVHKYPSGQVLSYPKKQVIELK